MLSPGTVLQNRYRILEKVGGGGFGYVYKAIDETFGCCVAIKETKEQVAGLDQLRKAFEREAKLLRNLKHDCLPRVSDYFFHEYAQFLVMDFIEGEDLAARLKRRNGREEPFDVREVLRWADKVLSALEYLHSRPEPIVHRDIKPSNIKLTEDGEIYLLDFGLAKGAAGQMSTVINGESSFSLTAFTHEYASLEQIRDLGTQPHSDIYSVGATLYHLLTGQIPIAAGQRDEATQRGHCDPLKPIQEITPTVPIAVSDVISQAMAIRWWDRISSAGQMRAALNRAASTLPIPNPKPDPQPASPEHMTQDQVATLPLQPQSLGLSRQSLATTPTQAVIKPARYYRSWLVAGLSVLILSALAVGVRLTFPQWFAPATSTKQSTPPPSPGAKAALVTPTDLRPTRLPGHTNSVFSVAFSPDGTMAASGGEDKTAILWDTRTWEKKFDPLTGHRGPIYSVAFSPDSKMLATASADKTIRLWDTQSGAHIRMSPHKYAKAVQKLSFSSDGSVLASFSGDKSSGGAAQIQLWYLPTSLPDALSGHNRGVQAITFVPGTKSLFSSGYERESGRDKNTLRLWDLETGTSKELKVYLDVPLFLVVSQDGKQLACGTTRTIELWSYQLETRRWEEQRPLVGLTGEISSLAFSPDNKTLIATTKTDTTALWDITSSSGQPLNLRHDEFHVVQWSSAFSPDAQTLLTGGKGKDSFVWRWQRPNEL